MVDALCASTVDHFVSAAADDELVRLGAPAVAPLLARSAQHPCRTTILDRVLPRLLCAPGSTSAKLRPIRAALSGPDEDRALVALDVIGRTSVDDPCPAWRVIAKSVAVPAIKLLDRVSAPRKPDVLLGLESLGQDAASAVSRAIALLEDPKLRAPAISLLGAIGAAADPAVPRLIQIFGESRDAGAVEALGRINGSARQALPELLKLLREASRNGCRGGTVPFHVLIGAVSSLGAREQGTAASKEAIEALRSARAACPKLETWLTNALTQLGAG